MGTTSSSASDETSAAATSSASTDGYDDDAHRAIEAKMANLALGAGVHPDKLDAVLSHYAKSLAKHAKDGSVDPDKLSDAAHAEGFRRIVAKNPEVHVHYHPPEATGPHEDHMAPSAPKGKTWKPGQKNTASPSELRAKGIRY